MTGHIVQRLAERYDLAITDEQVPDLQAAAQRNGIVLGVLPGKFGQSHEHVLVGWQGKAIICTLRGPDRVLVTVLPPQGRRLKGAIQRGTFIVKRMNGKKRGGRRARRQKRNHVEDQT